MQANIAIAPDAPVQIVISSESEEDDLLVELAQGMDHFQLIFNYTRPQPPTENNETSTKTV